MVGFRGLDKSTATSFDQAEAVYVGSHLAGRSKRFSTKAILPFGEIDKEKERRSPSWTY